MKVTPKMIEAAWRVLTRYRGPNAPPRKRDPRSIGSREVKFAIEAALRAAPKLSSR